MRHDEWFAQLCFCRISTPNFNITHHNNNNNNNNNPQMIGYISGGSVHVERVRRSGRSRVYSAGGCPPGSPGGTPSAPRALRSWRRFSGKSSNTSILPGRGFVFNVWTQLRNQAQIEAQRSLTHGPCIMVDWSRHGLGFYGETFTVTQANEHFACIVKLYKTINNLLLILWCLIDKNPYWAQGLVHLFQIKVLSEERPFQRGCGCHGNSSTAQDHQRRHWACASRGETTTDKCMSHVMNILIYNVIVDLNSWTFIISTYWF